MVIQGVSSKKVLPSHSGGVDSSNNSLSLSKRIENCLRGLWEAIVSFFKSLCCCSGISSSKTVSSKSSTEAITAKKSIPSDLILKQVQDSLAKILEPLIKSEYGSEILKKAPETGVKSGLSLFRTRNQAIYTVPSNFQRVSDLLVEVLRQESEKLPFNEEDTFLLTVVRSYKADSKVTLDCYATELSLDQDQEFCEPVFSAVVEQVQGDKAYEFVSEQLLQRLPSLSLTEAQRRFAMHMAGGDIQR